MTNLKPFEDAIRAELIEHFGDTAGLNDSMITYLALAVSKVQSTDQPVELGAIREIFIKMASVCRALEVAKKHHDEKNHSSAEDIFNVSLNLLSEVPQSSRVNGLEGLNRMVAYQEREIGAQDAALEAWRKYQDDPRPETRNDFLRAYHAFFDSLPEQGRRGSDDA